MSFLRNLESDCRQGVHYIGPNTSAQQAELADALESARVVGVLDAWAYRIDNLRWESWPDNGANSAVNLVNDHEKSVRVFYGATPDAARAAAAKAIENGEV